MFISPIIDRELRTALRRHRSDKSRFKWAASGAGVVIFFLLLSLLTGDSHVGSTLHTILFYGGLYLAVIPPAKICAGLFCEERRNQTLELLYLTGMGSGELFLGKLLGGILIASGDLLAIVPFLAVPFLCGGVSLDLFLATAACFPVVLLFIVAIGVLASVICRDDGAALALGVVMCGAACLALPLPYFLGKVVAGVPPFGSRWLCLSPAYGPYLVAKNFAGESPRVFWLASATALIWAAVAIVVAAIILGRNWRHEVVRGAPEGWRGGWERWLHGSRAWRSALRLRLLPSNPFQWLAEQDRPPLLVAWAWVWAITVVWLMGWGTWPHVWPSPVNFFITALLLVFGLSRIIAYASARRIGLDRRDGVLELLLTTPLSPEQIVDGQSAAIVRQFRPVRLTVLALCVLMMGGGFLTRSWKQDAIISYVLIWCFFFGWCLLDQKGTMLLPMWIGLNTGRPASAVFRLQQPAWYWLSIVFNLRNLTRGLVFAGGFPSGSYLELFMVTLVFALTILYLTVIHFFPRFAPANPIRQLLLSDMRLIARQPAPERHDPRFKKWNVRGRLPMSMSQYVESLPERAAARAQN
jgi:ABC-type Na+ efflux pump permease subunit